MVSTQINLVCTATIKKITSKNNNFSFFSNNLTLLQTDLNFQNAMFSILNPLIYFEIVFNLQLKLITPSIQFFSYIC